MLDYFEPGGSLSWRGSTEAYVYRIFSNEQEELLLKRQGEKPTPLEVIEVGSGSRMGLISHGQRTKLCRNIICIEPEGFPLGCTLTAPDFAAGALRPLYVMGTQDRQVEGLGNRKVLSVVLGDEEGVAYFFDLISGLMVWTNNWQLEPGQPKTCEVELEQANLPLSQLDYQTKPLQYRQEKKEHRSTRTEFKTSIDTAKPQNDRNNGYEEVQVGQDSPTNSGYELNLDDESDQPEIENNQEETIPASSKLLSLVGESEDTNPSSNDVLSDMVSRTGPESELHEPEKIDEAVEQGSALGQRLLSRGFSWRRSG